MKIYYDDLSQIPAHLKTKHQLLDLGLEPLDEKKFKAIYRGYHKFYHNGCTPTFSYNLYNITDTKLVSIRDNSFTAYNICKALYALNTAYPKGVPGHSKMNKVYARKHDLLPELHSQGRVQLVGYHQDVQDETDEIDEKEKYLYYIFQLGSAQYGFHIPVGKSENNMVTNEFYWLGPLNDDGNKEVSKNRKNKLPKASEQELDRYMDYLIDYFRETWGD